MAKDEKQVDTAYYYDASKDVIAPVTREHSHDSCELYFLERGSCIYSVGHRYYSLRTGDLIYVPSGMSHRTHYKKELRARRLINCGEDFIPPEILAMLSGADYVFRSPEHAAEISEIFDLIAKEYSERGAYCLEMLKLHTYRLFYLLARHKNENVAVNSEDSTVERALSYIKENFTKEITLSSVAEQSGVTPEHLSRTVKRRTGIGFNAYVNALRLEKAAYMLRNENGVSVSDIAFACGFNDSNYFSYRFKRTYGVAPTKMKYRKEDGAT